MSTIVKSVSFKADGVPQAGLTPTATARNLNTGADLVSSIAVAGLGDGVYSVTYTYTTAVPCRAIINAGTDAIDTRYIDVEFTVAELNASASLQTGDAYAIVNNGTYGNSALHTEVAKEATLTAMKGTDNKILISTDAQDLSGTLSVNAKKLNGQTPPLGSDNKMQITTDAMTEAYAADGVAPSVQQSLFQIMQFLHEASVSGTTVTVKKVNGSTTAYTLTINDATTPTSITRAT